MIYMVILYVREIIVFSSGIAQPFNTFCTDVACKCCRISSTGGHEFAPYAAGGGLCLKIWLCETSGTPIYGYFYRENNHEPIRFPGASIDKLKFEWILCIIGRIPHHQASVLLTCLSLRGDQTSNLNNLLSMALPQPIPYMDKLFNG